MVRELVIVGGSVATSGDYKIHTFTGPGTFCVSCAGNSAGNDKVSYLVVAGGAGGGAGNGGGGVLEVLEKAKLLMDATQLVHYHLQVV